MVTSGTTDVSPQKIAQPTPVPIVQRDVASGRQISYFDPVTGKPIGVTSEGGRFYSVEGTGDIYFRSAAEAQQYAASRGQQGAIVGQSYTTSPTGTLTPVSSEQYWAEKTAKEDAAKAAFGGVRTETMLAPKGAVLDVTKAVSSGAVPGYVLETSKGKEYFLTEQSANIRAMQLSPKPGEPGYHGTTERPLGLYQPLPQPTPQPRPSVPLFDPTTGKPNIVLPEVSDTTPLIKYDAKYGLMFNKDVMQLNLQKTQYEESLGIVRAKESEYTKGGFLPFTKEMTVAAETFTRSELLSPAINEMYANMFGTPTQAKVAAQKTTIARAQYYSGLSDKPFDVAAGVATSLPVEYYATGAVFKAGTLASRLSLGGLATGVESAGVPIAPTALRFGAKAIEPITVISGLGYAGAEIVTAPPSEIPGRVGVMAVGLPFGAAGWRDVGKGYTKVLTLGMKEVPAPIAPEVQTGATTFPEIKPGTTPGQLLKSFETPTKEVAGYHATEAYKGKELTVQYPTTETGEFVPGHKGDVPGLYVSPEQYGTSPFFLRVGSKYGGFDPMGVLQSEPLSPTVMHIELKGVGRLPSAARVSETKAIEFLKPEGKAEPGQAYLTTAIEKTMKGIGGKREAEAVVTPGTVLKEVSAGKYFEYEGMNIPIREYAPVEGEGISPITKSPKVEVGSEYLGYRRSFVPSTGYPAISGLESLIPIQNGAAAKTKEKSPEPNIQYQPIGDISILAKYYGINTADVGLFGYEGTTGEGYTPKGYKYAPSSYYPPSYSPYAPSYSPYAPTYKPEGYAPYTPTGYTPYPTTGYALYGGYGKTGYAPGYAPPKFEDTFKPSEYPRPEELKKRKTKPKRKERFVLGERTTPLIEPLAGIKDLFKTPKTKRRKR